MRQIIAMGGGGFSMEPDNSPCSKRPPANTTSFQKLNGDPL